MSVLVEVVAPWLPLFTRGYVRSAVVVLMMELAVLAVIITLMWNLHRLRRDERRDGGGQRPREQG